MKEITRDAGKTKGTKDRYYFSPEGKKYRSFKEIERFVNGETKPPKKPKAPKAPKASKATKATKGKKEKKRKADGKLSPSSATKKLKRPTKPCSAFMLFCEEGKQRDLLKTERPELSPKEINMHLRTKYKSLSNEIKETFVLQFQKNQKKYQNEMRIFKPRLKPVGKESIGRPCRVYYESTDTWYLARVAQYDESGPRHKVVYVKNGQSEWLAESDERIELAEVRRVWYCSMVYSMFVRLCVDVGVFHVCDISHFFSLFCFFLFSFLFLLSLITGRCNS